MTELKDKMIRTAPADWAIYDKVAKKLTKQIGFRVPVNAAIKIAMQEYLANHPELAVK